MPHSGMIGPSTDHIFIYLSLSWSVCSKAKALMENRLGKKNAYASQYLRLTNHSFSKYLTVHTVRTTFIIPSL